MQEDQVDCITWCCAFGFMLGTLIGIGEIALEVWLILHYTALAGLTGVLIYISYAFIASGGLAGITGVLGFSGIVKMNRKSFLMSLIFIPLTVACQAGVWTAMCVEQIQVVAELPGMLNSSAQYYKFIDYHYNCQLQNASDESLAHQLTICTSFLTRQFWVYVYSLLGLCILLVCIYSVLLIVAFKIIHKIKKKNNQVAPDEHLLPAVSAADNTPPEYERPPPAAPTSRSIRRHSSVSQSMRLSREPTLSEVYGNGQLLANQPLQRSVTPMPSAPPPAILRPVSRHPVDPNFHHGASLRGNFNNTVPLPSIPTNSYDHEMELYQQGNVPPDWNDHNTYM